MDNNSARQIEFLTELLRLKAVPRLGWLLRGVRDVESVAAHTYGVSLIAMLLADLLRARGDEVDVERLLRMALIHDMTEARTGDLPATVKSYFDGRSLELADERAAVGILSQLGRLGDDYLALWREYEARESIESRLVKAADKLDLLLQAVEYERGGARTLDEFWRNAEDDFSKLGLGHLTDGLIEALRTRR